MGDLTVNNFGRVLDIQIVGTSKPLRDRVSFGLRETVG